MTLNLKLPLRSLQATKALAASGSSSHARAAQAELQRRTTEALRQAVRGGRT